MDCLGRGGRGLAVARVFVVFGRLVGSSNSSRWNSHLPNRQSVLEAETGRYLREDDRSLESNPLTIKSGGCPSSLGEQFQGVAGRGSLMRVSLGKMRRNFREQGPLLKRFTVKDDQWGLYPDEDKCGGFHCV